jgi:hypothetical protein
MSWGRQMHLKQCHYTSGSPSDLLCPVHQPPVEWTPSQTPVHRYNFCYPRAALNGTNITEASSYNIIASAVSARWVTDVRLAILLEYSGENSAVITAWTGIVTLHCRVMYESCCVPPKLVLLQCGPGHRPAAGPPRQAAGVCVLLWDL